MITETTIFDSKERKALNFGKKIESEYKAPNRAPKIRRFLFIGSFKKCATASRIK